MATIIGFIIGSLGVVWPWKNTIYKIENSTTILDSAGKPIIENYQRFLPQLNLETFIAIAYIIFGISIVLALEWYGKYTKRNKI